MKLQFGHFLNGSPTVGNSKMLQGSDIYESQSQIVQESGFCGWGNPQEE